MQRFALAVRLVQMSNSGDPELELGAHLRPGGQVMTARPRATEVANLQKHRHKARIDARRADKLKKAKV